MKRGRLPLTALRSFEAAGRLLSFSRAAEELFVSQAAISRQVRELEALVGKPLFDRLHRRVALTAAGRDLLEQLTVSFDDMSARLRAIMVEPSESLVHVSVEPSFAGALLVPHLNGFRSRHPGTDVVVDADPRVVEFRTGEVDLAIRYSASVDNWPRAQTKRLYDVALAPVLSPELARRIGAPAVPSDLSRYTLLHDTNRDGWAKWFEAAGLGAMTQPRGPIYPDTALALQAARLGHGVALGDGVMEAYDLSAGTLVRPFDVVAPCGAYWLVAPNFERLTAPAAAFADWVLREFAA